MSVHNFHLPLPETLYNRLREEARRSHQPATTVAREALAHWLAQTQKTAISDAIAVYAKKHAGTAADLDETLEASSIEHLLASDVE